MFCKSIINITGIRIRIHREMNTVKTRQETSAISLKEEINILKDVNKLSNI